MSEYSHLNNLLVYLIKGDGFTMTLSVRVRAPISQESAMRDLPKNAYAFQMKEAHIINDKTRDFWSTYYVNGNIKRYWLIKKFEPAG